MAEEGAVLGTTFIEILPDLSKLKPALTNAERAAQNTGRKIESSISAAGKGIDLLGQRFTFARVQQEALEKAIASGSTRSQAKVASFAATVHALGQQIDFARASGQALGADQVREYATMQAALRRYSDEVREMRKVQTLAKGSVQEAGVAYRGFGESLAVAGGRFAPLIARASVFAFALHETYGALKRVGELIGIDYGHEHSILSYIEEHGKSAARAIGAVQLALFRASTGQFRQMLSEPSGAGLLAPLAKRWAGAAGPQRPDEASLTKAKDTIESLNRSQMQSLLQLQLERAKLLEKRDAIEGVQRALDALEASDMRARGFDEERIKQIITLKQANRGLADAMQLRKQVQDAIDTAAGTAHASIHASIEKGFAASAPNLFADIPTAGYDRLLRGAMSAQLRAAQENNAELLRLAREEAVAEAQVREDEALKALHSTNENERITQAQYDDLIVRNKETLRARLALIDEQHGTDFRAVLGRLVVSYGTMSQRIESLAADTVNAIETGWESGFFDAMTGNLAKLRGDFRSMLDDIAKLIVRFMIRQEIITFLKMMQGHASSGGAVANLIGTIIGAIGGKANGGVIQGGWRPFADGGVVTKPTLGLVGEGRYNEAVVPLPDGSRIPVQLHRSGAAEDKIAVHLSWEPGLIANIIAGGGEAGMARVAEDIRNGGPLHRQIVQVARRA